MRRYWRGFASGAAAGAGAALGVLAISNLIGRRNPRIVRLEKSVQVGRPAQEVFEAWANLDRLEQWSDCVERVTSMGDRSHWRVNVDGRSLEWDAEIEQFLPNQAIGWKSVNGPKHTGRINFSPLGNDTLVHVVMNYAPPARLLQPFVSNVSGHLEKYIEQVLRDFKAHLEGKGQEGVTPAVRSGSERMGPIPAGTSPDISRSTGTYGSPSALNEGTDRFGKTTNPVEFTSPPEAKR